jgi:cell division inhibitor SepF
MAIGDLWHRTLVYFGMADDEEEEYDDELEETQASSSRRQQAAAPNAQEDLERSYRERPNVRKLGPRRRGDDFDDIFADDAPVGAGARATPVRPVESPRNQPAEVHLVVPKNFNDAQQVADKFKGTVPVILNLQSAETDLAKRLIDFSSGLTYALDGGMQRVADRVFLLTPRNVEVSAEERARLLEKGFFNQY